VQQSVWPSLPPEQVEVERGRADALEGRRGLRAARDALWSYVPRPAQPRWVWHAMEPHPGTVVASGFGRRQDTVFVERQALWEPCGIPRSCTDAWGAYERHVEAEPHPVGQAKTPQIESQPSTVRTRSKRLVRRTICFAKMERLHDLVLGLFSNRYEFGVSV
jgi:insertion element IS1 protein InsB